MFLRAAAMTLRTVLLSLQALLSAAEPDDPQDAVVARQYKENIEMFKLTARHWTNAYAGGKTYFGILVDVSMFFDFQSISEPSNDIYPLRLTRLNFLLKNKLQNYVYNT